MMIHISILVPESAVLAAVSDPRYMFMAVNDFLKAKGKEPRFNVQLVGMTPTVCMQGAFTVQTDALLQEVKSTDLVIVPALNGDLKKAVALNQEFVPWIVQQHQQGAAVASLCIGAFLLASTGLLNGKQCSTHWGFANEFRVMFPEVSLMEDRIITEVRGIYTSGGATSYWNLLLYLIEKYTDHETAILTAKYFAIEIDRESQAPFIMFNGQRGHEDEPVKQAQQFIEHNVGDKISVEDLACKFAIGRRNFERRFKKATNNTPAEYIQRVKIEAAKKGLENSRKNVQEVMYEVGYSDSKAFRGLFKRVTGLSPVEYRNKFRQQVAGAPLDTAV